MPTEINPKRYDISASSMAAYKKCPVSFKLGYREGLRRDEDTESQRMGTNWHAIHEIYHAEIAHARTVDAEIRADHPDKIVKGDPAESGHANGISAVINHLNDRYAKMPVSFDPIAWDLERQILLTSFIGYLWYWQNDPVEVLASEVPFELPVIEPRTGMPLPITEVRRVGKIDHVVRWQGMVGTIERKSTSRSIDADSDYWQNASKDTQVSMYAAAFREMTREKDGIKSLEFSVTDGIMWTIGGESIGNTLYDAWHKPTIKPAMLSQKDTLAFQQSKTYFKQSFAFEITGEEPQPAVDGVSPGTQPIVNIGENMEKAHVEQGKKGFAIRETPAMYAARLLADIQERPSFYFQRREIARTDADLKEFREELFAIYQTQKMMEKHNTWYSNTAQCRATFPCPFIGVCYGPGHRAVSTEKLTPDGYKRIFVDLTINQQEQE